MPTRATIRKRSWRRPGKRKLGRAEVRVVVRVEVRAAGRAAAPAWGSVFHIPAAEAGVTDRTAEAAEAWAMGAAKPPKKCGN
jgi:hypothetical protein